MLDGTSAMPSLGARNRRRVPGGVERHEQRDLTLPYKPNFAGWSVDRGSPFHLWEGVFVGLGQTLRPPASRPETSCLHRAFFAYPVSSSPSGPLLANWDEPPHSSPEESTAGLLALRLTRWPRSTTSTSPHRDSHGHPKNEPILSAETLSLEQPLCTA